MYLRGRYAAFTATAASGLDRLGVGTDLDLACLGLLRHRDADGQHARVEAGLDVVGVDRVGEVDLPGERTRYPLADERLLALGVLLAPASR